MLCARCTAEQQLACVEKANFLETRGVLERKAQLESEPLRIPLPPEPERKQLWEQRRDLLEAVAAARHRVVSFMESFPEGAPDFDAGSGGSLLSSTGTTDGDFDAAMLQ